MCIYSEDQKTGKGEFSGTREKHSFSMLAQVEQLESNQLIPSWIISGTSVALKTLEMGNQPFMDVVALVSLAWHYMVLLPVSPWDLPITRVSKCI
jgi:hypothetical protein